MIRWFRRGGGRPEPEAPVAPTPRASAPELRAGHVCSVASGLEVRAEPPGLEQHEDVVFRPIVQPVPWEQDPDWGVYDRHGRLIEAAAYRRGPGPNLLGQQPRLDFDVEDLPWAPDEDYVYVGHLIQHYGHFLLSGLARLWPLERLQGTRLLAHGPGDVRHWFTAPYLAPLLWHAGIRREQFADPREPVRVRRLTVVRPSFEEHNFAHLAYGDTTRRIGRALLEGKTLGEGPPVYLSKTALTRGVQRFVNEPDLQERLAKAGVEIVHPERLSLSEQAALFATRPAVAGALGSALHTGVLAPGAAHVIGVSASPEVNSNFTLADRASGARATYLHFPCETADEPGFDLGLRWRDPVASAEDILRAIDHGWWQGVG